MRIVNNIMAMNAHRQLGINQGNAAKAIEKLSSGLRINRAGDDAAGLAISEKMRGQVRGLKQAIRNAQDGISLIQTAEGALNEAHAILQRMRELAVQSASDTNTDDDRAQLQKEIDQLAQELTRIAETTEFNTQKLLDGTLNVTFHIGANANQNISLQVGAMDSISLQVGREVSAAVAAAGTLGGLEFTAVNAGASGNNISIVIVDEGAPATTASVSGTTIVVSLASGATNAQVINAINNSASGLVSVSLASGAVSGGTAAVGAVTLTGGLDAGIYGIDVATQSGANAAITVIDNAIRTISDERSKLGAYQNRLEHTIANLGVSAENLQAAESRIRDVDMAAEMMEFTKNQILQQASIAMLAQANLAPQAVLQLLG